jgi:hypothetical protein
MVTPDNVRLVVDRPDLDLKAGSILCVEGAVSSAVLCVSSANWPDLGVFALPVAQCEAIELADVSTMHVIVETGGTAPDLADIFRLITYLRENEVWADVGQNGLSNGVKIGWIDADGRRRIIAEFVEHPKAFYVGPDGTPYDADGVAL